MGLSGGEDGGSRSPRIRSISILTHEAVRNACHHRPMTNRSLLVALGSSFAAGPTIEPVVDAAAMRSGRNYAHLAADRLGADLIDLTVSGATTSTILDEAQITQTGARFAPQIEGLPADADVVTVTAGGNDLGFIGSLLHTAWTDADPDGPITRLLDLEFPNGIAPPTTAMIDAATTGLARIVTEARARAPRARIVLVDYLTIIPPAEEDRAALHFSAEQIRIFVALQDAVGEAFRAAAGRTGAELLPMSSISRDHGLGSAEPWVSGFTTDLSVASGAFHPNATGMAAVAEALVRILRA